MRAPVYRHVETGSSLAGLSLTSFTLVLAFALGAIEALPGVWALLAVAGFYGVLRLAGHGRPPLYWQHWLLWHVRRIATAGRLSAAARGHAPRFPFGPYES